MDTLTLDEGRVAMLKRYANFMSALFGGPVYLAGSALRADNPDPRDWDVRLLLPDGDWALRYEPGEALTEQGAAKVVQQWVSQRYTGAHTRLYWRWADEMVKYSNMGRRQCLVNIDFQVYPASYWRLYDVEPRVRLDTRGDGNDI